MASHKDKNSLRRKTEVSNLHPQWVRTKSGDWTHNAKLRPGKTAEDKRIGAI